MKVFVSFYPSTRKHAVEYPVLDGISRTGRRDFQAEIKKTQTQ